MANQNPTGQLSATQQAEHVLAHGLLAAAVAATGGNDVTTAALAAGGSEAAAPVLAQALYGTQDPSKLTQEQKDTLTTIANLAGTAIGATTGQGVNVVASSQAAQNAVRNNYLDHDEMVSTRDKLVACADSECRKKVYQNSKALSQKNRDDFIKTCAKNGTSPACLAKKQAITRVIVEDRQGEFDSDGSVPEIDDMMRNLDEINLNDNTVGPALVAEQNAREAAIGYGATEKQAKELATIAAAAISIIQNKKGKGRGKPLDGSTDTVVSSSSQNAVGNASTTQVEGVVTKSADNLPVPFDGEFATKQLLGTTKTSGGKQINFHAADRMVNPPRGREPMSISQVEDFIDTADKIKKIKIDNHGTSVTLMNSKYPKAQIAVDGNRIITVVNPRKKK